MRTQDAMQPEATAQIQRVYMYSDSTRALTHKHPQTVRSPMPAMCSKPDKAPRMLQRPHSSNQQHSTCTFTRQRAQNAAALYQYTQPQVLQINRTVPDQQPAGAPHGSAV
jgi:hypothetical protein